MRNIIERFGVKIVVDFMALGRILRSWGVIKFKNMESEVGDIEFFPIKKENPKALVALKYWLQKRHYNTWTTGGRDKYDNLIIPLRWDYKPDSDWGKVSPVQGIIVLKGFESLDEIGEIEEILKRNISKYEPN